MLRNPPDMKVRLTGHLRQKIENAAHENNRTMNGEIVARLEQSFREEGHAVSPLPSPDLEKRLENLEDIWVNIMIDELDTMAKRLSALEKRQSEQSAGDLS
jgi:molybdopterin converting factor small subunit